MCHHWMANRVFASILTLPFAILLHCAFESFKFLGTIVIFEAGWYWETGFSEAHILVIAFKARDIFFQRQVAITLKVNILFVQFLLLRLQKQLSRLLVNVLTLFNFILLKLDEFGVGKKKWFRVGPEHLRETSLFCKRRIQSWDFLGLSQIVGVLEG